MPACFQFDCSGPQELFHSHQYLCVDIIGDVTQRIVPFSRRMQTTTAAAAFVVLLLVVVVQQQQQHDDEE